MKIIFLDIDGVLNSVRSFIASPNTGQLPYTEWVFASVDPIAVRMIERVLNEQAAYIVVSSSHRNRFFTGKTEEVSTDDVRCTWQRWEHDLPNLQDYMMRIGFSTREQIIGCTPDIPHAMRGAQIQAWLDRHPEVEQWAIIDDDSDMLPEQAHRFIKTTTDNGFMFEHYKKLEKMLSGEFAR